LLCLNLEEIGEVQDFLLAGVVIRRHTADRIMRRSGNRGAGPKGTDSTAHSNGVDASLVIDDWERARTEWARNWLHNDREEDANNVQVDRR
jgi:hypothetical protein